MPPINKAEKGDELELTHDPGYERYIVSTGCTNVNVSITCTRLAKVKSKKNG